MRKFLFLNSAQRFSDFALLLLRVFVGLFLIWSVWDNVTDGARMQEFASFLAKHEFPSPRDPGARIGVPAARHRGGLRVRPVHALGRHCLRDRFCRGHCHGRPFRWHARRLPVGLPVRHRSVPGDTWRRPLLGGCGIGGQRPAAVERRRAFQEFDRDGAQYRDQGSYRKCRFVDSKGRGAGKRGPDRDRAGRHLLQLRHGSPQAARVLERCGRTDFLSASEPDGSERVFLSTIPHFITRDTS